MANINLNSISSSPTGYVFFTDVPNILTVDEYNDGTKANVLLHLNGNLATATTKDNQWYIKINGETISNVLEYTNAVNKNFYIRSNDNASTAYYITRALRNCPTIAATFNIPADVSDDVYLFAKQIGDIPVDVETNIPDDYLEITKTSGTSTSSLNNALVDVEIASDGYYITTLEKSAYNASTAFDLSPVLNTIADYGKATPFTLSITALNNGTASSIGSIGTNHIANGYKANDSLDYINRNDIIFAQNIAGKLYIYDRALPITFYNPDSNGGASVVIEYSDSLRNTFASVHSTWQRTDSSKVLFQIDYTLDDSYLSRARYIKIRVGNTEAEYEVIKPLKATEGNTRVYWRNEYAGLSFFDFTGEKTTSENISNEEYQKNNFDYYTSTIYEDKKLYDKKAVQTVTVRSHLISKDGIWIFNSLKKAKKVWTSENKAIIIQSVQLEEQDNNDVYIATITYTFSNENQDD